jgi:hypothetical protein
MKFFVAAATLLSSAQAFSPIISQHGSLSTQLKSSIAPPERVAPDAGYLPDWEDRTGKSPEEFMKSDMNKPDRSGMWECPLTRWDSEG